MTSPPRPSPVAATAVPAPRGGVPARALVLAGGTFAIGTDAFVVAGVLPGIAGSLGVGVPAAGQLVTVFALAYALLSPVMAAATGAWPRRRVLLTGLVVLALGNAATALAPGYGWVLAARAVAAAGAAMFTPAAGATAAALAAPEHRGRALSYVSVGLVSSTALGVPLGTLLGEAVSWRGTIWFVTALAAVAALAVALWLPPVPAPPAVGLRRRLAPLGDRRVAVLLLATVVLFTGIYLFQNYVAAVLRPATGGDGGTLAALLCVSGVAGTVGNLVTAGWADRFGAGRVVAAAALALAAVLALVPVAGDVLPAAVALVAVYGFAAWSVLVPQQHRLIAAAPEAAPLVVALNAAALYAAVSLAGGAGALVLDAGGGAAVAEAAAGCAVAGLAVSWLAGRVALRGGAR